MIPIKDSDTPISGVFYIAGYGRSGSTLLDMLLGMHPGIFGAGELARVFDQWLQNDKCSCQQSIQGCDFWADVIERFRQTHPDITLEQAAQITLDIENSIYWWQPAVRFNPHLGNLYGKIWSTMMQSIADVSGSSIVVDSSKTTRITRNRPLALAKLGNQTVKLIHLVRDPRAVMWSMLRGSNARLEAGTPAAVRGGAFRALFNWTITNLSTQTAVSPRTKATVRVKYEDFVSHTEIELSRIADAFAIDLQTVVEQIEAGASISAGHGVAGNRLRRGGVITLHIDNEWRSKLPAYARRSAWLVWPLANAYGYRFHNKT